MLKKFFNILALGLLCTGTVCVTSFASTLVVGKPNTSCSNPRFSTISDAITAAAPGDVINICPALYSEQLTISKPLTLRGLSINDVNRTVIRPLGLQDLQGLSVEAVVTVMNTHNVRIENIAVDASNNTASACTPQVAGVHFFNASGEVENDAIFRAQLKNPQSCAVIAPGSGFGVLIDSSGSGQFHVEVEHSSIHDYTKSGVFAIGTGVTADVNGNSISGVGPSGGVSFQFAVFLVNGAVGSIRGNVITEGLCGTLAPADCISARSEGITLRAVGDGTVIDHNLITNAQSGIFVNFATHATISNNIITNLQGGLDGIDMQGVSDSILDGNTIVNATVANQGCGIAEKPGAGQAGGVEGNNLISHTRVNDAFCGVAYAPTSHVESGTYFNTLVTAFRSDIGPPVVPSE